MSFLASLLGGNLKLGGGVGFNDSSTNTSSDTNTTQNLNTSNTGTVTKNLAPFQSLLTGPISSTIMQLMTNPTAFVAPFAAQARDQANNTYAGLGDSLRQQFLGTTGGGQSGKFGTALGAGNLQRLAALQGVDTSAAMTAATLPIQGAQLAEQLLGQNFGQTTTGASTATGTGTSDTTGKSSTSGFSLGV